jgi:raffinose/stachyose/melibiose transport system substrate-binding protein
MQLEPMQKSVGALGSQFTTATAVIDGVFHSDVYEPINTGLVQLAMQTQTGAQVATTVQRAFDTWKQSN